MKSKINTLLSSARKYLNRNEKHESITNRPILLKHFIIIHPLFLAIGKLLGSKIEATNHAGFMYIYNHFEMFKSRL